MSTVRAADDLRRRRSRAGLSQEALAERAGIGVRTVRALESGAATRPHRATLLALAAALALPEREVDAFVAAWRVGVRGLDDMLRGVSATDDLRREFDRLRPQLRDVAMLLVLQVGADRRWERMSIRRTVVVEAAEGAEEVLWFAGFDSPDVARHVRTAAVSNVEVVERVVLDDVAAVVFRGTFGRRLRTGETSTITYTYEYDGPGVPADERPDDRDLTCGVSSPMSAVELEVRFADGAHPSRCERVVQAAFADPAQVVGTVPVSPFGVAQLRVEDVPAGVHGLRWDWD